MTKQEYMDFHSKFCSIMMDVTKKKNADYTGGGDDPFANFRKIGDLVHLKGIDINEVGFLTRMSDKFSRIGSFIEKGEFQVKDENFIDTCLDLANYCALLAGYHLSKGDYHAKQPEPARDVRVETPSTPGDIARATRPYPGL